MQTAIETNAKSTKKRVFMSVEKDHVAHIRCCLLALPHEDFTVAPILSGWGVGGYWSSEHNFTRIGERVMVGFTTDIEQIRPLLAAGFGILASKVLKIQVTDCR